MSINSTIELDPQLARAAEAVCEDAGFDMASVITAFMETIVRTGASAFEDMIDPFERKEHQDELRRRIEAKESGRTKFSQVTKTMEELERELYG